jgi:hypothetical protein
MADPVRPLVVIAGAQALAAVALLVGVVAAVVGGAAQGLAGGGPGLAVAEVAIWALVVLGLGLVWLGLYRRRALARTPFLLVQAFALVVVPAFLGSDLLGYRVAGIALGAAAVLGLILGLRPSVRERLS